ncbi:hypothetical protein CEUSTIGMA_g2743.t1 [Chlamydomonas eustigma]|uniref:Amidinotransferase n=1 Tax=Chlamydomonas eustigma TaxID=1157962 RepID=A0A250WWT2_9CHLO|nr:hypothetical protein CEUSTIGMA_g2743.t1 [Chlamydomonas eustigma]|eukprot:GAX75298.1 hypothetical protein CEUSTIGMA_g2743.t1 [Chlamydomonas eustigma]
MLLKMAILSAGTLAQSVGASSISAFQRALASSLAAEAALSLGSQADSPVLIQLPQRSWGAAVSISSDVVKAAMGPKLSAGRALGVLREPFASFDLKATSFSKVLAPLRGGAVAVSTSVTRSASRVVVDEYVQEAGGSYRLSAMATDLLTYLSRHHVRVALVPDVTKATSSTAAMGAELGISQSSNEVLMVSPTAFGFNEQAAQDNSFMHSAERPGEGSSLTRQVLAEYSSMHHQLTEVSGVKVNLFEHSLSHGTPDACFPNNWFSTHPAGEAAGGVKESTLVLYPMKHPNRSAERRRDIIEVLKQRGYAKVFDMSKEESNQKYFEGTGVLLLDRINGVVYVNVSERADAHLAAQWTKEMGYKELVTFRSTDLRGHSVYHTNVMMAIGTGVAIVCAESVKDAGERSRLLSSLSNTHEVVEISLKQMDHLCGNALEVKSSKGLPVMAMSTQAYNALSEEQRAAIRRHVADIIHAPIDTLEKVGGGGVRCTLAEVF